MTSETPNVSTTPIENESLTSGRVKWFNNKAGYGFITVLSGEHVDEDVFVHHSAITVNKEQYRYLIQGEYVSFNLCSVKNETHKWQAGSVRGMNNGKLMCETRHESRESHPSEPSHMNQEHVQPRQRSSDNNREQYSNHEQTHYRIKSRGQGPREGDEWMLVRRSKSRYSPAHNRAGQPEILHSRNKNN